MGSSQHYSVPSRTILVCRRLLTKPTQPCTNSSVESSCRTTITSCEASMASLTRPPCANPPQILNMAKYHPQAQTKLYSKRYASVGEKPAEGACLFFPVPSILPDCTSCSGYLSTLQMRDGCASTAVLHSGRTGGLSCCLSYGITLTNKRLQEQANHHSCEYPRVCRDLSLIHI